MESITKYLNRLRETLGSLADESHPEAEGRNTSQDSLHGGAVPSDAAPDEASPARVRGPGLSVLGVTSAVWVP